MPTPPAAAAEIGRKVRSAGGKRNRHLLSPRSHCAAAPADHEPATNFTLRPVAEYDIAGNHSAGPDDDGGTLTSRWHTPAETPLHVYSIVPASTSKRTPIVSFAPTGFGTVDFALAGGYSTPGFPAP
jgi:hypothetical protein